MKYLKQRKYIINICYISKHKQMCDIFILNCFVQKLRFSSCLISSSQVCDQMTLWSRVLHKYAPAAHVHAVIKAERRLNTTKFMAKLQRFSVSLMSLSVKSFIMTPSYTFQYCIHFLMLYLLIKNVFNIYDRFLSQIKCLNSQDPS